MQRASCQNPLNLFLLLVSVLVSTLLVVQDLQPIFLDGTGGSLSCDSWGRTSCHRPTLKRMKTRSELGKGQEWKRWRSLVAIAVTIWRLSERRRRSRRKRRSYLLLSYLSLSNLLRILSFEYYAKEKGKKKREKRRRGNLNIKTELREKIWW